MTWSFARLESATCVYCFRRSLGGSQLHATGVSSILAINLLMRLCEQSRQPGGPGGQYGYRALVDYFSTERIRFEPANVVVSLAVSRDLATSQASHLNICSSEL
ncbi:hypothetical protein ACFE04_024814 [Oxalis oulophora]